ncbi:hypothetical protein EMPS_04833 [Entomortierella parvispora]|uniref:Uncharacterized protein n=1 Tax=Entomortierella parvispora TaxID=205924 RepID=A0A9P3LW62_9FUNG|nr:hypothetical protein EMPS_04833 [Entomortierella parvispora]
MHPVYGTILIPQGYAGGAMLTIDALTGAVGAPVPSPAGAPMSGFTAVWSTVPSTLLVSGGEVVGETESNLAEYMPSLNQWTTLTAMATGMNPGSVHGHCMVPGDNNGTLLGSTIIYNIQSQQWVTQFTPSSPASTSTPTSPASTSNTTARASPSSIPDDGGGGGENDNNYGESHSNPTVGLILGLPLLLGIIIFYVFNRHKTLAAEAASAAEVNRATSATPSTTAKAKTCIGTPLWYVGEIPPQMMMRSLHQPQRFSMTPLEPETAAQTKPDIANREDDGAFNSRALPCRTFIKRLRIRERQWEHHHY